VPAPIIWRVRRLRCVLAILAATAAAGAVGQGDAAIFPPRPGAVGCPPGTAVPQLSAEYRSGVQKALASGRDRWGEQVLSRPDGPTYDNVASFLRPALWAVGPTFEGGGLTASWVHYVPFGQPIGPTSRNQIALHVADGSQVISNRAGSTSMRTYVGTTGEERFGECVASLDTPRLLAGYLPVLEVQYTDYDGIRYHQESLATFIPGTQVLASYVKVTANRGASQQRATRIRFDLCECTLTREGSRLVADGNTVAFAGPGAANTEHEVVFDLDLSDGADHAVYLVRINAPSAAAPDVFPNEPTHLGARQASIGYWDERLDVGTLFSVPEQRVMDAQRNLLIQNLLMTVRYSLGNTYEAPYQPESSDTVETLGSYGFTGVYRTGLQTLLGRSKGPRHRNWEMGEKLLRGADYYWLTRDAGFIEANTPLYARYAADLARQQRRDPRGLLERQRYSSDIPQLVYGLHQISRALLGLKAIVSVWSTTGRTDLAGRYGRVAQRLEVALRRAVARSRRKLRDGSLFTDVRLLKPVRPYDRLTATKLGGYWNLVAQFGFASRVYEPGSAHADGTLRYLYRHGSRFLGSLRSRRGATADVYGVQQAKFLADNGQADQLVLSLYGNLAHSRAPGTLIGGEVANVGPLAHKWPEKVGVCKRSPCRAPAIPRAWSAMDAYRGLYNPPNSANNTFFLSVLRTMLVNETTDHAYVPQGLQLALATPRAWLADGKEIVVRNAPTFFGPVSYRIESALARDLVTATVDVPATAPGTLHLTLRVPGGKRLVGVTVNGSAYERFDPAAELVDLTGLTGTPRVSARYGSSS
jgi:hypothetical protein